MEKSRAIKAGLGYTIGNYLIKGISFFTIPIFARLLESSDYGKYNTYMAFEAVVYIFVGLALHTSFKKAKYRFDKNFDSYVSSCTVLSIVSFTVFIIFAVITYPLLKGIWSVDRILVVLLFIHSFGSALIQFYNTYVAIFYDYKKFLKLSIFNAIFNILLSIGLILIFDKEQKYIGRILGTATPVIIIGIYIIFFFFKKAKPNVNKKYWRYGISYSFPIIPHGLSQIILSQFDRIMINNMIGASEAGIYSFAYNVYTIIQVTSNSLSNVWEPWFFEKIAKNDIESIRKRGQMFAVCMLGFSTLLVLLAPEIIILLGTSRYSEAVYCVPPIVIGGYFSFLYILPCEVEYYYEKTKNIGIATCSAAALNFALNYFCIKQFGYITAAYTTLATYLLYFLFHYLMARKIQGFFLYSNRMIALISITALIVCFLGICLIPFFLIRITIFWFAIIAMCIYLEHTAQLCSILRVKLKR